MYVTKETINKLAKKGITIKIYPKTYEEFYERCLQREYIEGNFYYRISETNEERNYYLNNVIKFAERKANNWYDANTLYIVYGKNNMIAKKENIKSKEITVKYVLELIEKDKKAYTGVYGKFTQKMKKILSDNKIDSCLIYPTTYGIGIFCFNCFLKQNIRQINDILNTHGIEYKNEFSEKHYVWRYKISKKAENLNKI